MGAKIFKRAEINALVCDPTQRKVAKRLAEKPIRTETDGTRSPPSSPSRFSVLKHANI